MKIRSAVFSKDGRKRFELIRDWRDEVFPGVHRPILGTVNFIMLNPSIADEQKDDPTVRKCIGFARRWGYNRLVITNLIPIVETNPWNLPSWSGTDSENNGYLLTWMSEADMVIAGWGSQPPAVWRTVAISEHIHALRQLTSCVFHCIGITKKGDPLHPSRAAYTDDPVLYVP